MCDTFVALSLATADNSLIFGKNSDREPNEAQILEYLPSQLYTDSGQEKVSCTYISVPQVKETYAVLLSRPFWMWGAEMGANEKGVLVGNEAVFTKMPTSKSGKLTGMDLLRLALERSATADQALETIIQLLSDFGQGGICGYQDKKMFYHNSYIIADTKRAWVLETAGDLWVAREIKDAHSISNGLTIGEEYDRSHPELIDKARNKGWLKKGKTFNFAECYSDWLITIFSACKKRQSRSLALVNGLNGKLNVQKALTILRDHGTDEYRPSSHFLTSTLCVHGANNLTRNSGTTGSLVAHLTKENNTFWATGTAAPCTGIFKPIRFGIEVLPDIGPQPGKKYDSSTLWWHHETLHRNILNDYQPRINRYKEERDQLETSFIEKAKNTSSKEFFKLTSEAFKKSRQITDNWIEKVKKTPIEQKPGFGFRRYWKKQNEYAEM